MEATLLTKEERIHQLEHLMRAIESEAIVLEKEIERLKVFMYQGKQEGLSIKREIEILNNLTDKEIEMQFKDWVMEQ